MNILRIGLKCIAAGMLFSTGTALLALPGGIPLILAAIAILATEFDWAERLQSQMLAAWERIWRRPTPV